MGEGDELPGKTAAEKPLRECACDLRGVAVAPSLLPNRIAEFELAPSAFPEARKAGAADETPIVTPQHLIFGRAISRMFVKPAFQPFLGFFQRPWRRTREIARCFDGRMQLPNHFGITLVPHRQHEARGFEYDDVTHLPACFRGEYKPVHDEYNGTDLEPATQLNARSDFNKAMKRQY